MTNIRELPSGDKNELRALIEKMKRGLPEHIELLGLLAQADYAKFQALTKAGFQPAQAIELMKAEKITVKV
jgi:hypothetical protein